MEPFKNLLNPALVQAAATQLKRRWRSFDAGAFTRQACDGLEALEMKARAMQICAALDAVEPRSISLAARMVIPPV